MGFAVAATIEGNQMAHSDMILQLSKTSDLRVKQELQREKAREAWAPSRKIIFNVLHTTAFDLLCAAVILFNMVVVVIETDISADGRDPPSWLDNVTACLLVFYIVELSGKLYSMRSEFFEDRWNVLDFLIVGFDMCLFILSIALDDLPSVSILRAFRLVRLARAINAMRSFNELHSLIRSFECALKAVFWGVTMVMLTLVIWSILAVEFIHPINERIVKNKPHVYEGCDRCPRAFASVFDSALTFWKQLVAGDSWGQVSEPIIEESPWASVFLLTVAISVNIMLLNLILSVIVEAGAAAALDDQRAQAIAFQKDVQKAEAALIDFCIGLDSDGSGNLSIQEFTNGYRDNEQFRQCLQIMRVTEEDMQMIFNICDEDGSGDVDYREFVDQIRRIKHSGQQMLLNYVTDIRLHMHRQSKDRGAQFQELPMSRQDSAVKCDDKFEENQGGATASQDNGEDSPPNNTPPNNTALTDQKLDTRKFEATERPYDGMAVVAKADVTAMLSFNTEKLKLIAQASDNLTIMMSDLVEQSKAQSQLLNAFMDKFASQTQSGLANAIQSDQATDADACCRTLARRPMTTPSIPETENNLPGAKSSDRLLVTPSEWASPPTCFTRVV